MDLMLYLNIAWASPLQIALVSFLWIWISAEKFSHQTFILEFWAKFHSKITDAYIFVWPFENWILRLNGA
jgi:hypothetical protein